MCSQDQRKCGQIVLCHLQVAVLAFESGGNGFSCLYTELELYHKVKVDTSVDYLLVENPASISTDA